jgi:hypothetical protein
MESHEECRFWTSPLYNIENPGGKYRAMTTPISDSKNTLSTTMEDVLGAIALQAQRIVAAASQYAAGGVFPAPEEVQKVIDRMSELNQANIRFLLFIKPTDVSGSMTASSGMSVRLD